ncbi:hypothetical protein H0H93_001501 [Arthromyces matolae]|nr:hypothetical protein H0H93_001501 [Arthromyces matolae]
MPSKTFDATFAEFCPHGRIDACTPSEGRTLNSLLNNLLRIQEQLVKERDNWKDLIDTGLKFETKEEWIVEMLKSGRTTKTREELEILQDRLEKINEEFDEITRDLKGALTEPNRRAKIRNNIIMGGGPIMNPLELVSPMADNSFANLQGDLAEEKEENSGSFEETEV